MPLRETIENTAGTGKRLSCVRAFALASDAGVPPDAVRALADELGVRIRECQLGLFGYGTPHQPDDKRLQPLDSYAAELLERLERFRGLELPCAVAWAIAEEAGVDRLTVGSAAQALGIHLSACQLGCF